MVRKVNTPVSSLTNWLRESHAAMMAECSQAFVRMPAMIDVPHERWMLPMEAVLPLVDVIDPALLPGRLAAASRVRRHSFLAGRLCAERCLEEFGMPNCAVACHASGAPVWPDGVTGSITHTARQAGALACEDPSVRGIGIDSELCADASQTQAIEDHCCTPAERAGWVCSDEKDLLLTVMFSAKEAYYKAIYPLVRRYVDFLDVEVRAIDRRAGRFVIAPVAGGPFAQVLPALQGYFVIDRDHVHTTVLHRNY